MKPVWASKTLWTNFIMAIVAFFPVAQTYIMGHPMLFTESFIVVNVILRLVTKSQITLGD